MRLTDIQRCEVRPGRLVEFTLSPATVAAARDLPDDSRPPAYIQESHLRTVRSAHEDGLSLPTWLGTVFDLPGRVDLDALEEALRVWTLRHETLRSGFRWAGGSGDSPDSGVSPDSGGSEGSRGYGDEMRRFTLAADAVALRREVIGDFPDQAELAEYLQDRFDAATSPLGWPNLIYAAVVRDDCTSVYTAFDHVNVDGHSIQRVPGEIQELYAAGVEGRTVAETPVGSYIDFCEIERADADRIDDTHAIVARWREYVRRGDGQLPNFPVDLGLDESGGAPPAQKLMCHMLLDADEAAAFEAYCRPFGGSLVGFLAATGLVLHEIGGQPVFRTLVPFHTRVTSRWSDSVGWYVGCAPIEVQVDPAPDFLSLLRAVRAELRANRPLAGMPLARVVRLLGDDFRPASSDLHASVSYLDARDIPGSDRWVGSKAYGLGRVSYGDKVGVWFNRLHEGVWFASRHPDTDAAHKNMRLYAERVRDVILSTAVPGPRSAARTGPATALPTPPRRGTRG